MDVFEEELLRDGYAGCYLKMTPAIFQKSNTDLLDYFLYCKFFGGMVIYKFPCLKECTVHTLSQYKLIHGYEMYYTRDLISKEYIVGYAISKNGVDWIRDDKKAGLQKSKEGRDSEMACYPFISASHERMTATRDSPL